MTRAGVAPPAQARMLPHPGVGLVPRRTAAAQLPGMGIVRPGFAAIAQRRAGAISATPLSAAQLRLIGPGSLIEPSVRRNVEAFFDADFSSVRLYHGAAAPAIGALAFTLGEAICFAPGLYDPHTREGIELLGHELDHPSTTA